MSFTGSYKDDSQTSSDDRHLSYDGFFLYIYCVNKWNRGVNVEKADANQYIIEKIVGLWALVTFPMVFFRFVLLPLLVPIVSIHSGILFWLLMIVGMRWKFVLSLII